MLRGPGESERPPGAGPVPVSLPVGQPPTVELAPQGLHEVWLLGCQVQQLMGVASHIEQLWPLATVGLDQLVEPAAAILRDGDAPPESKACGGCVEIDDVVFEDLAEHGVPACKCWC